MWAYTTALFTRSARSTKRDASTSPDGWVRTIWLHRHMGRPTRRHGVVLPDKCRDAIVPVQHRPRMNEIMSSLKMSCSTSFWSRFSSTIREKICKMLGLCQAFPPWDICIIKLQSSCTYVRQNLALVNSSTNQHMNAESFMIASEKPWHHHTTVPSLFPIVGLNRGNLTGANCAHCN